MKRHRSVGILPTSIRKACGLEAHATILLLTLVISSCSAVPVSREHLNSRLGLSIPYKGSRWYYYGTKNGCDRIIHEWDDFWGKPGSREFKVREGELNVGERFPYSPTKSYRRPIKL